MDHNKVRAIHDYFAERFPGWTVVEAFGVPNEDGSATAYVHIRKDDEDKYFQIRISKMGGLVTQ